MWSRFRSYLLRHCSTISISLFQNTFSFSTGLFYWRDEIFSRYGFLSAANVCRSLDINISRAKQSTHKYLLQTKTKWTRKNYVSVMHQWPAACNEQKLMNQEKSFIYIENFQWNDSDIWFEMRRNSWDATDLRNEMKCVGKRAQRLWFMTIIG